MIIYIYIELKYYKYFHLFLLSCLFINEQDDDDDEETHSRRFNKIVKYFLYILINNNNNKYRYFELQHINCDLL